MIQDRSPGDGLLPKNDKSFLWQLMQKPAYVINFNWASILFLSFFVAYGYYGAITPEISQFKQSLVSSILYLGLLTAILVSFGFLEWKVPGRFQDSITIQRSDLLVFISYFAVLFSFSYSQLQFSLYSDEISYSATSHGHGIRLSLALVKQLQAFDDVAFRYLVQAISLVLLASLLGLFVLSKRFTWKSRIIIFSLLLILGRLAFSFMGGNGSPHPSLQLLPPFIFGSVFGITDFSFKLSYFVVYITFILVLYRMVHRVFSFVPSYLLALAIGTIPLLWHLGSVVEHSLWASICFTLVLAEIATSANINYVRLTSFISLAVLMRQPSFLAILPVLMLFAAEEFKTNDWKNWLSKLLFVLIPTIIFIPFLGRSLIYGTPSTDSLDGGSSLQRVLDAVDSDVIWSSIATSVPYWWIIFIPLAFIPLSKKMFGRNIIFLFFFAAAVYVYYSIHPSLWGYAKYQAEYAIPFAILGMLLLAVRFAKYRFAGSISASVAAVIVLLNAAEFMCIPKDDVRLSVSTDIKQNATTLHRPAEHFLAALPYNYHDAYAVIKSKNLTENSFSIGPTYGIFPEIMNGYSAGSIRTVQDIFVKQDHNRLNAPAVGWNVDLVESDSRIKVVLVGAISDKQHLMDQFRTRGWSVLGEYKNIKYGTSVVAMLRPVAQMSKPVSRFP